MSWDWQHDSPVTYDQNNHDRYYSSTPHPHLQTEKQGSGLGQDHIHEANGNGSGQGVASGSGSGSGRQTPQTAPAPALGFYPNPAHTLPTHMTEQYFPPSYSIDPNNLLQTPYRPSATYPFDNAYQTPHQNGNGVGNGNGNQYTGQALDFGMDVNMNMGMGLGMGQGMDYSQFPDYSVPPPRSSQSQSNTQSISQPQSHSNSYESIHNLQQQLNYSYQDPGGTGTGNSGASGSGGGTGSGQITPDDTPSTEAFIQYMSNPASYTYPNPIDAAQGTISPSQLGQQVLNKQFSSLFMSRGSSSSASSTEGGHDWSTPALLDEINQSSLSNVAYPHTNMSHFPAFAPSLAADASNDLGLDGINAETMNAIRGYLTCPNRLGYGERKLVISTPKVGQKSYGNEKRFLCPHPQAALYGTSWWTPQGDSPTSPIVPPRINISLSGEEAIKDSTINWATAYGKPLNERHDEVIQKLELPFMGNVAGRFLHISDHEAKRSSFTALVRIRAPAANSGARQGLGVQDRYLGSEASEIIGTFESKEIKIISKPSKKKTNTKSTELVITHGSTIAMYTRTKSQTASTRYLNIESDLTNIRGSDGQHIPNARSSTSTLGQAPFSGLVSSGTVWESFIIWLADPSKPAGLSGLKPLQADWPSQPMNAMITPNAPPIRYNALVILQSVTSGKCTPIMTIRRIDQDSDAVGQDGTVVDHSLGYAPEGEMLGDMVAQVQKVGMELYDPILSRQQVHNRHNGDSRWMACDHEHILDRYVQSERKWQPIPIPYRGGKSHSTPTTPNRGFHILPMTPHTSSTNLPSTPSSPVSLSSGSSFDYFGPGSRKSSSTHLISPISSIGESLPMVMPPSTDGGPLRRPRTGSTGRMGPLGRPAHKKRQSQDSHSHSASASSSFDHLPNALGILEQRQSWSLSIGDVAVWTIVGTEQTSYTFYVPPTITISDNPLAPFPQVTKYLPPGSDKLDKRTEVGFTPQTNLPLAYLYGKGFSKLADGPRYDVYYGDQKARHVEARCEECMAVSEPIPGTPLPAPITLVRRDGRCVIPTGIYYDHPPYQPHQVQIQQNQQQSHNQQQQQQQQRQQQR